MPNVLDHDFDHDNPLMDRLAYADGFGELSKKLRGRVMNVAWLKDMLRIADQLIIGALKEGYFSRIPLKRVIEPMIPRRRRPGDLLTAAESLLRREAPGFYHTKNNSAASRRNAKSAQAQKNTERLTGHDVGNRHATCRLLRKLLKDEHAEQNRDGKSLVDKVGDTLFGHTDDFAEFPVDDIDIRILTYLLERKSALCKYHQIATGATISVKTAGNRVRALLKEKFVRAPRGPNSGVTLTQKGYAMAKTACSIPRPTQPKSNRRRRKLARPSL